jgi:hypothetical protein
MGMGTLFYYIVSIEFIVWQDINEYQPKKFLPDLIIPFERLR